MDVEPLEPSDGPQPLRHWWHGQDLITFTGCPGVDAGDRVLTDWGRYELWRDGVLVRTELEPFNLQRYDLDEFTALLRDAGFTTVTVYADYEVGRPPTARTRVWTLEAAVP